MIMKNLVAIAVVALMAGGCATTEQVSYGHGCVFYQINCSRAATSERKRAMAAAYERYEEDLRMTQNRRPDSRNTMNGPGNSSNPN